ncbi:hypothetical protein AVEN_116763-1 [Araneus ventricosus]|uniref:Uncharacterized protein n=1 Tax=Araneus ventricosus TaxID=182803 RepID=A0A4Y2D880_ARAVE|nr:hypothetical protein AVEN_116763-1 [Araneus ventricosus]
MFGCNVPRGRKRRSFLTNGQDAQRREAQEERGLLETERRSTEDPWMRLSHSEHFSINGRIHDTASDEFLINKGPKSRGIVREK